MLKFLICAVAVLAFAGCDRHAVKIPDNQGNYKVIRNEGTLIGEGVLTVKGVKVVAKNTKLYVNGVYFGLIPEDAESILHVYDNGSFILTVNGERRHPVAQKKTADARKDMNLKFNHRRP
ncbi:MAG: hypothetical protein ACI4VX_00705 [Succinivibrionaceae bacterium]